MLSDQVYDVIAATRQALADAGVASVDEVRRCPPLLRFSPEMRQASSELKRFLMLNLYRHPRVLETTGHARTVVADLFRAYCAAPQEMPAPSTTAPSVGLQRRVADYIAGMTDRFALREHQRLTGLTLFP